jgi:hypothetical protein
LSRAASPRSWLISSALRSGMSRRCRMGEVFE